MCLAVDSEISHFNYEAKLDSQWLHMRTVQQGRADYGSHHFQGSEWLTLFRAGQDWECLQGASEVTARHAMVRGPAVA